MADQVATYFGLRCHVEDQIAAGGEPPKAALLSELRAMESSLALTPLALARLRWVIDDGGDVMALRPKPAPIRERVRGVDPTPIGE